MISWSLAFVLIVCVITIAQTALTIHKRRHEREMKKLEQKAELDEKMLGNQLEQREAAHNDR